MPKKENKSSLNLPLLKKGVLIALFGLVLLSPYYRGPVSYTHLDVYKRQP